MQNIEEVIAERDKLAVQYEGGLPNYLQDYFDHKIKQLKVSEEIKNRKRDRYATPKEERVQYAKDKQAEFWRNHKYRIVKKRRTTSNPVFEEPLKGEERVEEDVVLSELERRLLIQAAGEDLYLFAVRYFPHYLKKPSSALHRYIYKFLSRELNKTNRRRGFNKAIAAPRGNAKCLEENTLIQRKDGSVVPIKDIKVGDNVVSINNNLRLDYDKIIAKDKSGVKQVRDLRLKSGRKITLTDEHRLFNIDGEIKLKNINVGEKLATPRELKCSTDRSMKLDEAIFLANMLAEGCVARGTPLKRTKGYSFKCSYTNFDSEVVDDFKKACINLGFGFSKSSKEGQYNIQKARPYLRKLQLAGCDSHTKFIPNEVFTQDDEFLKLFISRFVATDGWVTKHNPSFGITLANEYLIDQLFSILLRLGFRPVKQIKSNDKFGAWAVVVHGVDQLKKLADIGILHKQNKLLNTIDKFSKNKSNPNIDTIDNNWKKYLKNTTPHFLRKNNNIRVDSNKYHNSRSKVLKVAEIDDNKFLYKLATSDIYWDEVVSISEYYKAVTYDIETEKYHNFIANNIVSHNSSLVSTILPLWCICFQKKKFIIMVSDTSGQAVDFLSDIKRELEFNKALHADFPHIIGHGQTWKTDEIITANDIKILALGTKSRIRGRRFGISRPDLVIGDDLENSEMVRSESERDYVRYQWFNKDLMHVEGEEGTQTDLFIVGTVLGKDSLLNALLDPEEYPQFASKRFSSVLKFAENEELWQKWEKLYKDRFDVNREETARKFYEDHEEEMLEGVEVLWPEGDPYYDLMVTKVSDYSGFLCFDKDTKVVMNNNRRVKIKDIKIGDSVLSGDGTYQKVEDKNISKLNGRKLYDIKIAGYEEKIRVTEDHPFFIFPNLKYRGKPLNHQNLGKLKTGSGYISKVADKKILDIKPRWKKVKDLKVGDATIFPINVKKDIVCKNHDPDWYWLVGLFLAEGHFSCNNSAVCFSMNVNELHFLEKAKKICDKYKYGGIKTISKVKNEECLVLTVCSVELVKVLSVYGRHSYMKHLTKNEFNICYECFTNLWDGYFSGDGYYSYKRNNQYANSTSYKLLKQFQEIFLKFGHISYFYKMKDGGPSVILGRNVNIHSLYSLCLIDYKCKSKWALQSWIYNNKLYSKIQSIEEVKDTSDDYITYCLTVSGSHTYCVDNAIVHNCEKQNSPIDYSKVLLQEDSLVFENFSSNPLMLSILKNKRNPVYGAIDVSLGKKSSSGDYSCITTITRDLKTGLLLVKHFDIKRRSVDMQIEAVLRAHSKFKYTLFAVETNAFQYVVAENLRKASRKEGVYVPVKEINNYQDKKMRIESIVPFVLDGTVIFDAQSARYNQMYALALEQITTFTGINDKHDDAPDSLEMAVRISTEKKFKRRYKSTR